MTQTSHSDLLDSIHNNNIHKFQEVLHQGDCNQTALDSGLCWASRYGNVDYVVMLLQFGANPNAEVWGGFTPLIWAAMYSPNFGVLPILIDSGCQIDHQSSKRKQTALHAAINRGSHQCASILLNAGANPDVQDYLYKTPLLHAVIKDLSPCVGLLIKHNCNVDLTGWVDGTSVSPFILALLHNNLEITKMLLLAGAKFENTAIYQTYTITQYFRTVESDLNIEVRPVYLQQQCRVCIRHLLKPRFREKLKQIMLPQLLKEFLDIVELDV